MQSLCRAGLFKGCIGSAIKIELAVATDRPAQNDATDIGMVTLDTVEKIKTCRTRHAVVGNNDVNFSGGKMNVCFGGADGRKDFVFVCFQLTGQAAEEAFVVVNQENCWSQWTHQRDAFFEKNGSTLLLHGCVFLRLHFDFHFAGDSFAV